MTLFLHLILLKQQVQWTSENLSTHPSFPIPVTSALVSHWETLCVGFALFPYLSTPARFKRANRVLHYHYRTTPFKTYFSISHLKINSLVWQIHRMKFFLSLISLLLCTHLLPTTLLPFFSFFLSLFLAALGLCCCAWAFFNCGERGLLFVVMHGLLIAVASLVEEHGL